ncbi:MAG: DUF4136 domain-containing protein [Calditrichae bacterium]|nr:DUF4136 domain-containing protein [Calditrichota bacterium]MCB9087376.1 DUF4136 domain-containing protein [Calditrichia bacterium]
MSQQLFRLWLAAILMALLAGCSPVSVKYDYDPGAAFGSYKTYSWIKQRIHETDAPAGKGSQMVQLVQQAVDRELAAKGFERTESPVSDFKLAFHTGVQDKIDVNLYGYGYWRRHAEVRRYKEGTLVLDVVDSGQNQLVWRGWGTSVLGDPSRMAEKIDQAVNKILEKFPPKTQ